MRDAREKVRHGLLLDALGDPVDLNSIDWHVRQQNPSATPSEVQNETLEVIRSLVSEGSSGSAARLSLVNIQEVWPAKVNASLGGTSRSTIRCARSLIPMSNITTILKNGCIRCSCS